MARQKPPRLLANEPNAPAFRTSRRQRFLTAEGYAKNLVWTARSIASLKEAIAEHMTEGNDSPIGQRGIFKDVLALTLLEYTAGRSMQEVADSFSATVSRFFQWHVDYQPHVQRVARELGIELRDDPTPLDFEDLEDYQDAVTLASLAVLLGDGSLLQTIGELLRRYRGEDMLFDALVGPAAAAASGSTEFFHLVPYDPLIDAFYTAETSAEASAFVQRYLDGWYTAFSGCSWHDGHLVKKDHMSPYNGYWSFEAAAICVLHGIDDSSFRDHLVYPKDLADWAREHDSIGRLRQQAKTAAGDSSPRLRCQGGQPCPQAGTWHTPAAPEATRSFAVGETMPELRSDYGVTIWQLGRA